MVVAALQGDIQHLDIEGNATQWEGMLPEGADLILLPETFLTGFATQDLKATEPAALRAQELLLRWAEYSGSWVGGSAFVSVDGRYRNRFYLASPSGELEFVDKRHLFGIAGEAEHFDGGQTTLTVDIKGWKIRLAVCYDLRFPVWLRNDHKAPYDGLVFVANWPKARRDAWMTLLRARAMENQAYVLGVNRIGIDGFNVLHSGDSRMFDPLGEVMAEAPPNESTVLMSTWHATRLKAVRKNFPFLEDQDTFELSD